MSDRVSRVILAVLLACGTVGVSTFQRTAPATDATSRAVAAAEAFLATLDQAQRQKANIALNEKTRTVWSNLPSGITMQVGATERNGLKLGAMTPAQEKAALALVATTLSREGYEKAMAIVDADQVLETRKRANQQAGRACPLRSRGILREHPRQAVDDRHVDASVRRASSRHQRDACGA